MEDVDGVFELEALQSESLKEAEIEKGMIVAIYNDYLENQEMLKRQAEYFGNILNLGKEINSVKWRVKDPIHLLTKIVRKRKEALKKKKDPIYENEVFPYLSINVDNYKTIINDLVGIRAIYLFKANWTSVNSFILKNFSVSKEEGVKIYHAKNDNLSFYPTHEQVINEYKYSLEVKDSSYRSTHYIIKGISPHDFKFELQTRTILDEAWGEIDHHIRYPDFETHEELQRKMSILNGSISGSEELASRFYEDFQTLQLSMIKEKEVISEIADGEKELPDQKAGSNKVSVNKKITLLNREIPDSSWDVIIKNVGRSIERNRILDTLEKVKRDLNILDPLINNKSNYDTFKRFQIEKNINNIAVSDIFKNIDMMRDSLPISVSETIAKTSSEVFNQSKNDDDKNDDDKNDDS